MTIPAGFHELNMHTTLARRHINIALNVPENPIATVQIIHGMNEHKERYYPFMEFLVKKGFAVITADNRGHGKSINTLEDLGYTSSLMLYNYNSDLGNTFIKRTFRDIPHFIIGHSLGSLITLNILQVYSNNSDGVFLLGTPSYNRLTALAEMISSECTEKRSARYRSEKIRDIAEKFLNRNFEDVPRSWICSNPEVVMQFNNDPLCNFTYTLEGYKAVMGIMHRAYNDRMWKSFPDKNYGLPIRFISGKDDPVMFSEEKFFETIKYLKNKGFKNISHKLYAGMRHEVLNETDKLLVWEDIADHLTAWSESKWKLISEKYTFNSLSEKLPIVNGVLYPDRIYNYVLIAPDETKKRNAYHFKEKEKKKFYFSEGTKITINSEIICDDLNCKAVCGGGSYDGAGFVMLESLTTGKMLWLASFDNSNPFISIQRYENTFIVTNNCNEKWHFDISDMDNIKISIR